MSDMTIQNAIHCMKAMICEEVCEECDYYGKTGTDHCEADAVRMAIKALEEQPHWISCGEGLPKYPFRVQIQLDNGWIITGYYSEEHWYTVPHSGGFLGNDEVEAWRELPKAYDGGDAK